jgi:hypothetical protein
LGFVDRLLGHVIDRLQLLDLFEDSLLVVTADHGISFFWDQDGLSKPQLYSIQASEILYVPLLVKAPGQHRGEISDDPAQTIDILPTIADMLGIDIPWELDGASLLRKGNPRAARYAWLMSDRKEFGSLIDPDFLALEQKVALFGTGGWDAVYNFGPHRHLIGTAVDSWPAVNLNAVATLADREILLDIDPQGPSVPAYIEGEIQGDVSMLRQPNPALVVAVNGIIKGSTTASVSDVSAKFMFRVPPNSFRQGRNEVSVHAVIEDQSGAILGLTTFMNN